MAAPVSSGEVGEAMKLLQTIFTVTLSLQEACGSGDLGRMAELLHEREDLLERAAEVREQIRKRSSDAAIREQIQGRLVPMVTAIRRENEKLMTCLQQRRSQTVASLRQLQNQKSILAYTR